MDPEQTAPIHRISLFCVHTVCHRGFLKFQQTRKATPFVVIGALRVKKELFSSNSLVKVSLYNSHITQPNPMDPKHKRYKETAQ